VTRDCRSWWMRDLTTALSGVGTVGEAGVVNRTDCCILMDGSASIGLYDVAGLDDKGRSLRLFRNQPGKGTVEAHHRP
jgi:hypothetical protein